MDFSKYRQTAQEIENNFIENGRSYEDALNKIVIDLFDEMEEDYKQEQSEQLFLHGVSKSFYCYDELVQIAEETGDAITKCDKQCEKCKQ